MFINLVTHQLVYQIAQQRIADLHRVADHQRLARTARNHHAPPKNRRRTRLAARITAALTPTS
jgi:hypothetical protein